MSNATNVHAPEFARRLTGALLELKSAEAACEAACAIAIADQTDPVAARRLVVATARLSEAQRAWNLIEEVIDESVCIQLSLEGPNHAHG